MAKKRKPFGGVVVDFAGRNFPNDTLEYIFGTRPITPPQMTKMLWSTIKRKGLLIVPKKKKKRR